MTKKNQKQLSNKKSIAISNRNKLANIKYDVTIKTFLKLFKTKLSKQAERTYNIIYNNFKKENIFILSEGLLNKDFLVLFKGEKRLKNLNCNIYSAIDRALKNNVIHENYAIKKKSITSRLCLLDYLLKFNGCFFLKKN